uniref:Chloride channel CLIC-like protein 1 n=1 Tax=Pundamilia nyererei TaxID=303518 RepID=A0A3B4ET40_9CICH
MSVIKTKLSTTRMLLIALLCNLLLTAVGQQEESKWVNPYDMTMYDATTKRMRKPTERISQQPTCSPVFKRFLSRLLKAIQRAGVPSDSTDFFYDAKLKMSKQAMEEIQAHLESEDGCRPGALDNAISQILVDVKPHDYGARKWPFEDTFGVELHTLLKIVLFILVILVIIMLQLRTKISWFVLFQQLFAVCLFVSVIWNWFYLYKELTGVPAQICGSHI